MEQSPADSQAKGVKEQILLEGFSCSPMQGRRPLDQAELWRGRKVPATAGGFEGETREGLFFYGTVPPPDHFSSPAAACWLSSPSAGQPGALLKELLLWLTLNTSLTL